MYWKFITHKDRGFILTLRSKLISILGKKNILQDTTKIQTSKFPHGTTSCCLIDRCVNVPTQESHHGRHSCEAAGVGGAQYVNRNCSDPGPCMYSCCFSQNGTCAEHVNSYSCAADASTYSIKPCHLMQCRAAPTFGQEIKIFDQFQEKK